MEFGFSKAALSVAPNAKLTINSADTKWLKVTDNDGIRPNYIIVSGTAKIDGVKITSWNLTDNDIIKQKTAGSTPRPYIRIIREAGPVDILNSEIAYLGYNSSLKQGLSYYGGDGSDLYQTASSMICGMLFIRRILDLLQ